LPTGSRTGLLVILGAALLLAGLALSVTGTSGLEPENCPLTGGGEAYAVFNVPLVLPPGTYYETRRATLNFDPIQVEDAQPGTYTTILDLAGRECNGTRILESVTVWGEWSSLAARPQVRIALYGDDTLLGHATITQPDIDLTVTTMVPATATAANGSARAVYRWTGQEYTGSFEARFVLQVPAPSTLAVEVEVSEPLGTLYVSGEAVLACNYTVVREGYWTTTTPVPASFYLSLQGAHGCAVDLDSLRTALYGLALMVVGVGVAVLGAVAGGRGGGS